VSFQFNSLSRQLEEPPMPSLRLTKIQREEISKVVKLERELSQTPQGQQLLQSVAEFRRLLRAGAPEEAIDENSLREGASAALEHLGKVPKSLREDETTAWVSLDTLKPRAAQQALNDGLQALSLGAAALLDSRRQVSNDIPQAILRTAFGADSASRLLRSAFIDRKAPGLPPVPGPGTPGLPGLPGGLPSIDKLVLEGTLRDLLRTFAECGLAAQAAREWSDAVQPIGQVLGLSQQRACAGDKLTITFDGMGSTAPAVGGQVVLALPTRFGCSHIDMETLQPGFMANWRDAGTFTVLLPQDIYTGCIGFFLLPPPMEDAGPCTAGSLVQAAGMWQSMVADQFGPQSVLHTQFVVDSATRAETARHRALPCPSCRPGDTNHLLAGPPQVDMFRVIESGPVHPRGTLTITWSVSNADRVRIEPFSHPDSEGIHELPALPGPLANMSRLTLMVPCTRRWEGGYTLTAENDNACAGPAVTAAVTLTSGFSHYRLGCARTDITDARPGLGMAGFAYERQKSSGQVQMPLWARAFVIHENVTSGGKRITIVVADIWTCTQIVKREVLRRLNQSFNAPANAPLFTHENLLIAGTHTHAGPGGYSEYFLYNLTLGGFDEGVFNTIVNGICRAVTHATGIARPGRLFVAAGELADCGSNRSFEAFQRNPEYTPGSGPELWTDREMLLLSFFVDRNNRKEEQDAIGALNWYAIHPTSLGMFNDQISGDNKGHAELLFEAEMDRRAGVGGRFVAAFGNGNAGDVSGNMTLDALGRKQVDKPLDGDVPAAPITIFPIRRQPGSNGRDLSVMQARGEQQFNHALLLWDGSRQELSGSLQCSHTFVDMHNVPISGQPGARTWPAALGVSFGAGSSEDSIAYATMGPLDIDANIIEGMNTNEMTAGAFEFWGSAVLLLGPRATALAAILATGGTLAPLLLSSLLSAVAALAVLSKARSYGAALVGRGAFDGKVTDSPPKRVNSSPAQGFNAGDACTWLPPGPNQLGAAYVAGHGNKPIMFDVGGWRICPATAATEAERESSAEICPLVPQFLPMHLLVIGTVAIAAVPAEFTGMAGRRLKVTLLQAMPGALTHVAISNYSNGYSGYVATEQEYDGQHYEGASTLYGPFTLAAYQQTFIGLVNRLSSPGSAIPAATATVPVLPAIYLKP
jgi:hypothetical protein